LTARFRTWSSCFSRSQKRDLHPTDEGLSVGTPDLHPTNEGQSVGTPDLHPTNEGQSVGTPDLHPTDEGQSVGTPGSGHPDWFNSKRSESWRSFRSRA
jgi:hypothetical protein